MTTSTLRPASTVRSRRIGTVFSVATGAGMGVGMALSVLLLAITGWPFGIAMAVALPAAMIGAILTAVVVLRRGRAN